MSTLASQIKEAPAKADRSRLLILVQHDKRDEHFTVIELASGLTNAGLAEMICDGGVADLPIIEISEKVIGESHTADIAEDVAREIEKLAERAVADRGSIQNCAAALLDRFGFFNAVEARDTTDYLNERAA